ncbi:hypothetical protein CPJCM30710_32170 [Clostridium polyendosporum]|uniref:DUF2953 domain-containing protein n=1 Tax=Clostridium polyendosporum TaxID=69208 RepID=A0A919S386_9CLOT|nr:DUF2953 domain-containing protein [Clostridium polyendosporum]GIM30551.1 hypothetical protein CPJCM30710_32170 [Clostridium polyendosporum]
MNFLYIIITIVSTLLTPIPLKTTIILKDKNLNIYLYRFKIFSTAKKEKDLKIDHKISDTIRDKFNYPKARRLMNLLSCNPIKPKIKMNYSLEYGFDDASTTAVSYGIIHQIISALNIFINVPLKLIKSQSKINPVFNSGKFFIYLKIKSIISVNLVKIIYIIILVKLRLK